MNEIEVKKPLIIALLTARGGSIRLPRKNIKIFAGHPLVAWGIMAARCSRQIDDVYLTTDDEEIAEVGRRYGAKIIMRPVLDNDTTVGVVFNMAVETMKSQGINPDILVTMLPTSPMIKPDDIDNMISAFKLYNTFKYEPSIDTFSPDREMFIFKNEDDMTCTYNKPYYLSHAIADKSWNYSKLCGGWSVCFTEYAQKVWTGTPVFDSEIDKNLKANMWDGREKFLGYALESWQCFETDYECYFRMCELLMEEFILKGRGMKVYTDYAREFRKIVTWEEETKQLNLGDYAGNLNQLGENK